MRLAESLQVTLACLKGKDDPYWRDSTLRCNVRGLCRGTFRDMLAKQSAENPAVTWTEDRGWFSSDFVVQADWRTKYIINYLAENLKSVTCEDCDGTLRSND